MSVNVTTTEDVEVEVSVRAIALEQAVRSFGIPFPNPSATFGVSISASEDQIIERAVKFEDYILYGVAQDDEEEPPSEG